MASLANQVSCFLFFVVIFASCQIEARESKFFAKYIHLSLLKKDLTIPSTASPSPSPAPITNYISNAPTPTDQYAYAPAPLDNIISNAPTPTDQYPYAPAPLDNIISNAPAPTENAYAPAPLDNIISNVPAPTKNAYAPAPLDDIINNSPAPLDDTQTPTPSPTEIEGSYYGLYGKGTNSFLSDTNREVKRESLGDEYNNKDTEMLNYGEEPNTYVDSYSENALWNANQKNYNRNTYNNNVGSMEPQGMSDTRLLDNGKYYYNVDVEQDNDRNMGGGYFGNYEGKSKFEFDTMEEYEKQEGYPDFQQEFIP